MTSGTPRPRRPRDPEASRAAILAAAREAFTELGYDGASIREIARRAVVATGLVLRHFESKRALFVAAFPVPDEAYAAGSREGAMEAMLARLLAEPDPGPSATPFVALIRSAATRPEAAAELRRELQRDVHALLGAERPGGTADAAGSAEAEIGVELLGALMIGVSFVRHILATGPLATAPADEVARLVEPLVRGALAHGARS